MSIYCRRSQLLTSDGRTVDMIYFKDRRAQLFAGTMKVGLGKEPVKLLKGADYREFWKDNKGIESWIGKNIWRPGKKITWREISVGKHNNDPHEHLMQMAKDFSAKAVRGLMFVSGDIESAPLAKAKANALAAQREEVREAKISFYDQSDDVGMF